jgi:hypothetical protein
MKRLRNGRSIGALRQEMLKEGYEIGTGTLHRAVKGELTNRLESLEKIAQFFEVTVDQLLQMDGVDETYWPFTDELQKKVIRLSDEELSKAENVLRAHLGLPQLPLLAFHQTAQMSTTLDTPAEQDSSQEAGAGWAEHHNLAAPSSDGNRSEDRGRPRQKGGRGA